MKIQIIKYEKKRFTELGALATEIEALKTHLKAGRRSHMDARPWFILLGEEPVQKAWLDTLGLSWSWQSARKLKTEDAMGADIYCAKQAVFFSMDEIFWQNRPKWQSFLKCFNRRRGFKAPHGIIVPVSLASLQNEEKMQAFEVELQKALKESVESYFGKIPVYVVLTDLDQVEGFEAYAQKIRPEQKDQIFGFSHPFATENTLDIDAQFKALHKQLQEKLLSQLMWDNAISKNSDAFFFPNQLAALYTKITNLCHHITHASPNLHRLILRGVYFTAKDEKAKTCFSEAILRDVLLKESKGFSTWHQIDEFLAFHRKRILIGLGVGMVLLLSIWWLGILHDESYLNQMNDGVASVAASSGDEMGELIALQQLYDMSEHNDRFMIRYLGIFFPNKVYNAGRQKYEGALQNNFEPMMAQSLNQGLTTSLSNAKTSGLSDMALLNQDAAIYNWLSSYLMLNELNHFDSHVVRNQLMQAWQSDSMLDNKISLYDDLVNFGMVQEPIDPNLVAKARDILGNQPIEIRAFFALKANASIGPVILGGNNQNLFNLNAGATVDGFYTLAASKQYLGSDEESSIKQTLEQSWVLGNDTPVNISSSAVESLMTSVNQFYWSQYFTTWQNTLNGVSIKSFANIAAAENYLNNAGKQSSAFGAFWQQMSDNLTNIPSANYPSDAGLNSFATSMNSYLSNPQNYQNIVNALNQLGSSLSSANSDEGSLSLSASILNKQVAALAQLQQLASTAPAPIQAMLNSMVTQVVQVVFSTAEHALENRWQSEVAGNCQKVVGDSSSFVGASDNNLNLSSFSRFFNSSGVGGQFISDHITNIVSIQNGQVQSRSAYGVSFRLPGDLQEDIVRLLLIRNAFFANGNNPSLSINFTPMYLSKNLADFTVNDEGQSLFYQNGPRISQNFNWPNGSGTVVIKFMGLNGQTLSESYPGQWGLIKFLNSATVSVIDQTHYALTFSLEGYTATYEVSLNAGNFAGILALQNFQCL